MKRRETKRENEKHIERKKEIVLEREREKEIKRRDKDACQLYLFSLLSV